MDCYICHSNDVHFMFSVELVWDIFDCGNCGVQFVSPLPSLEELEQLHKPERPSSLQNKRYGWLTFHRQWRILNGLINENRKRVLDFGCGGGQFLDNASHSFWGKYGIDISKEARDVASQKGIITYATLEEADFKDNYFDVVVMFATIEHLPDPKSVVVELHRVLKEGGLFAVMTGDVTSRKAKAKAEKWHMYCPPEHLFFFSAKSIDFMMDEIGLKKRKSLYTDGGMYRIPFLDVLYPVLKRLPLFDHYYGYYIKEQQSERATA